MAHVYTRVVSTLVLVTLIVGCSTAARDASTPNDPSKLDPVTPATGATLFSVGGSVSGLLGSGLVLQNNAGDNLAVGKDGNFQFATSLAKESAYKVNVLTQPSAPSQTCAVTQSSDSIVAANITDVAVACTTNIYSYTVTASAGANGSITPGNATVNQGATTNFTVTPNIGYTASVTGCAGTLAGTIYTTGAITAACAVTASFNLNSYPVTATVGANGTISPSTSVAHGATTSFTVTPSSGYTASVTGCGGTLAGTIYTTGAITAACAVTASFSLNSYAVTATAGANGTISPSTSVTHGATTSFIVTPNLGYTASISGCFGTPVTNVAGPTVTYATGPVTAACTVTANFTIIAYAVSGAANPVFGGTVTTTTPAVNYNTTANFTVTAAMGYKIVSVSGCGGAPLANVVSPITYTTGAITGACAVTASFNLNSYPVTATAGANGTISPSTSVAHGATTSFTVTPNIGYTASVTGCGGTLTGTTYTTGPITASCAVTASFSLNSYTVTATAGANGTISPSTSVTHGATTSFTVTPNTGYTASISGCGGAAVTNVAGPIITYATGAITSACTVSANFTIIAYIVSGVASPINGGAVTTTKPAVNYNTTAIFTVTPNTGYSITGMTGSPAVSGCANGTLNGSTYTTGLITGTCTVTANFSLIRYTVTATASANGTITPAIAMLDHGLTTSFTVKPSAGYRAIVTGCGGTLANGIYTTAAITADCTVTASFLVPRIEAGIWHNCALTSTGGVLCWGYNYAGQLGNGSSGSGISTPGMVIGLSGPATALSSLAYHTCALTGAGTVQCWGDNLHGQLGNGSSGTGINSPTPVTVTGLSGQATALAAGGSHTCALTITGAVQCWGYNNFGQLGNGSTQNSNSPVTVIGLIGKVTALVAGDLYTCALNDVGAVQCWGDNLYGQLGNGSSGTGTNSPTPVTVTGLFPVSALEAGGYHNCALSSVGAVRCWGYNVYGQIGNNSFTNAPTPVTVLSGPVTVLSMGLVNTCAVTSVGAQCWGRNGDGQLGGGTVTFGGAVPVTVASLSTPATALAVGANHTCALTSAGTVQCWGYNGSGQLGNGGLNSSLIPVTVIGLSL